MSTTLPSPGQPGYISLMDAQAILLPYVSSLINTAKQSLSLFLSNPVVVRQASSQSTLILEAIQAG